MARDAFFYLLTFFFIVLLTDFLRRQALTAGLVDRPSTRKRHRGLIPPVGGEAIFLGCLLSALALRVPQTLVLQLFAIGAIVVVVGAVDDCFDVSASSRLLAQVLASGTMALGAGVHFDSLGAVLPGGGELALGALAVPFTVFCTVGVINAFNMADGMDGLSGSLALVALTGMAAVAAATGSTGLLSMLLIMASGIAAFLSLNARCPWRWRASVFLGDAGSTFLGFALTWFVIRLSQGQGAPMSPETGLWLLMVPLFDTVYVMFRRLSRGRSPMAADRQHLHHYLLRGGLSVTQSLAVILSLSITGAGVGLATRVTGLSDQVVLGLFVAAFVLYCGGMTLAWWVHPQFYRFVLRRRRHPRLPIVARVHAEPADDATPLEAP